MGDLGIVIQVKSREELSSDADKEHRWCEKKTSRALSQGMGTIRLLQNKPRDLTNLRGRTVRVDGNDHRWLVVVLLDHPDPPEGVTPALDDVDHPAVVLLRRDWEFLFDQLKSTHAVAHYLERVANDAIQLGREPMRYYELALADQEAEPEVLDPTLVVPAARLVSSPLLPMAPAASDDLSAHQMVRMIFEDIATTRLATSSEVDRLRVLAELDRLHVGERAQIGQFVIEAIAEVRRDAGSGVTWKLRSIRGSAGQAHLGFGACSRPIDEHLQEAFSRWVQLRHHDVLEVTKDVQGLTTVGVLLTPRTDGRRPWDTTMTAVSGELAFSREDLKALRELWPTPEAA